MTVMPVPYFLTLAAVLVLIVADVWFMRELRRERAIRQALESRRVYPVVTAWCQCTDGPYQGTHLHSIRVCGQPTAPGEACGRYPGHGGPCSGLRGIEGPNTRHLAGVPHRVPR